jgi:2',3'-cyclic-nucleotide 2'-phosphodiesterase (5'-nucleotidase family)
MHLDALALGNHEFDHGVPALETMVGRAAFPVLCANLFLPDTLTPSPLQPEASLFPATSHLIAVPPPEERAERTPPGLLRLAFPYALYEVGGVTVGVIGAMTEEFDRVVIPSVSRDVTVEELAGSIGPWVERIRPRCDLVVLLSHCGVEADTLLASRVPGIDIIVGGHDHRVLPDGLLVASETENGLGGTLVLGAGSRGNLLGRLRLAMREGRIEEYREELIPIGPGMSEDPAVAAFVAGYRERMGEELAEVIGTAPHGLPRGAHGGADSPLGSFVAEAMRRQAGADLALQNRGGNRADLPPGPVTLAHAYAVLPFENQVVRMTLTGEEVQEMLVQAVGRASVAGATFDLEDGKPVRVRVGGEPLRLEGDYLVATNSFCYQGGGGFTCFAAGRDPEVMDLLVRDAFVATVRERGTVGP